MKLSQPTILCILSFTTGVWAHAYPEAYDSDLFARDAFAKADYYEPLYVRNAIELQK